MKTERRENSAFTHSPRPAMMAVRGIPQTNSWSPVAYFRISNRKRLRLEFNVNPTKQTTVYTPNRQGLRGSRIRVRRRNFALAPQRTSNRHFRRLEMTFNLLKTKVERDF
jgi:hypothetical protein